jgi:hypothetical protein
MSGADAICVFRREVVKPEFSCSYFSARPQPSVPVKAAPVAGNSQPKAAA